MSNGQTAEAVAQPQERRQAPRVVAGRPGRMRLRGDDQHLSLSCSVVDISQTGCRLTLPRASLPRDWNWKSGSDCSLDVMLKYQEELLLPAKVVWSQRTQSEFDLLGLRFVDPPPETARVIDHFVLLRLHAGLTVQEEASPTATESAYTALEVPLEVEVRLREDPHGPPYRLSLLGLGEQRLQARYAPKEGETRRVLPAQAVVDLSVFPPSWARGEKRTIRFAGRVLQGDEEQVELGFHAAGNDLAQMIRDLIPERIVRPKKPMEIDTDMVLLILGAIVIMLIIAYLSGS